MSSMRRSRTSCAATSAPETPSSGPHGPRSKPTGCWPKCLPRDVRSRAPAPRPCARPATARREPGRQAGAGLHQRQRQLVAIGHAHRPRVLEVCVIVMHGSTIETSSSTAPIASLAVGRRAYCDWRCRSASGGRKLLRPTSVAGAILRDGANLHIDTRVEGRSCGVANTEATLITGIERQRTTALRTPVGRFRSVELGQQQSGEWPAATTASDWQRSPRP